jgi:hypothetical protein
MNRSGNSTGPRWATDPACFRALATGSAIGGVSIGSANQIEAAGEVRKARVIRTAESRSTVDMAPVDEGLAPYAPTNRVWR